MQYIIFDLITLNMLNIKTSLFIYYLNYIKVKEFILSIILLYILNENILLITILIIMYAINILLYKYVNKYFIFELITFTFFYFVLFKIDAFYFVNVLLVIVLKYTKYNRIRWSLWAKKNLKIF